jgi:hypothetical protein
MTEKTQADGPFGRKAGRAVLFLTGAENTVVNILYFLLAGDEEGEEGAERTDEEKGGEREGKRNLRPIFLHFLSSYILLQKSLHVFSNLHAILLNVDLLFLKTDELYLHVCECPLPRVLNNFF